MNKILILFSIIIISITVFMIIVLLMKDKKAIKLINIAEILAVKLRNGNANKAKLDYGKYNMSILEKLLYFCIAAIVIFFAAYVLYRSFIFSLAVMPLAFFYIRQKTKDLTQKQQKELSIEFKDLLYSLSSSLASGKSVEMAFKDAERDLSIQYPDENVIIIREINYINYRIDMNDSIEDALYDFAQRSKNDDIKNFADVFQVCKRTGGDLIQVIKSTTEIINDKILIRQDIDNLIAERKLEQRILNIMPFGLVGLISISASDFMQPVFTTVQGRISMTLAVILFYIAFIISKKLMNIEV